MIVATPDLLIVAVHRFFAYSSFEIFSRKRYSQLNQQQSLVFCDRSAASGTTSACCKV